MFCGFEDIIYGFMNSWYGVLVCFLRFSKQCIRKRRSCKRIILGSDREYGPYFYLIPTFKVLLNPYLNKNGLI